jgi:hypothetical protein
MKKLLPLLLFILIFAFSVSAQARKNKPLKLKPASENQKVIDYSTVYEDIWMLYAASDQVNYFLNPSKATRKKAIVRVWTEKRDKSDSEVLSRILYEVNCGESKMRSLAGVSYFSFNEFPGGRTEKFKNVTSWDTPTAKFEFIIPDTIGESLKEEVCVL